MSKNKKPRVLIIVESPSKAHKITSFVPSNYKIIASAGHIFDLATNADGKGAGIGVDLNNNLKEKYVIIKDKMALFNQIIEEINNSDEILIGSDGDREGEIIGFLIYDKLKYIGKPIKRISFNEITKSAILKAIANPRDFDMNLVAAARSRRVLDRIAGFLISPFLRECFNQNLSGGRVQSAVIKLITDREKSIKSFIPKEYWNIYADLKFLTDFKVKYDGSISNKNDAEIIVNSIKSNPDFTVLSVDRKPKKVNPYPPLVTLSIQQIMSSRYGWDATRTMDALQRTYEAGAITYLRSDSVRITPEFINIIRDWLVSNGHTIPVKPNVYEAAESSADSHEAIRCVDVSATPTTVSLSGDDKIVYGEVWRYTVASQMSPAVFDTLSVHINVDKYSFKASGKALTDEGFYKILGLPKETKIEIPNLNVGDKPILKFINSEQNFTKPPARFNEASLIKELSSRQIGRPSTMATILKGILTRAYVIKNNNVYSPTDLGINITNCLSKYFDFLNSDFCGKLETQLDQIAAGKINSSIVMTDFWNKFKMELKTAIEDCGHKSCDKCCAIMVKRTGPYGQFYACSGCRNFINIPANEMTIPA